MRDPVYVGYNSAFTLMETETNTSVETDTRDASCTYQVEFSGFEHLLPLGAAFLYVNRHHKQNV